MAYQCGYETNQLHIVWIDFIKLAAMKIFISNSKK